VQIVERGPAPKTAGTGIYLPGNAVRALTRLALGGHVVEPVVRIGQQRVTDHRGDGSCSTVDVTHVPAGSGTTAGTPADPTE
jgi:2-polyprenyl-6-methoxyphenol hydroxylase-like FAD-dependent oxidoreductase